MDDAKQHLLDEESSESLRNYTAPIAHTSRVSDIWIIWTSVARSWPKSCLFASAYFVFLHITLLVGYTMFREQEGHHLHTLDKLYSPANDAIKYEIHNEHATDHHVYSIYSGPPTAESVEAWNHIIEPTFIRTSREELVSAGESVEDSVTLGEEDGFLAALGVYHEVHCLRRLRLYLYKDIFYPNITTPERNYLESHLDHCIETLRISVMCAADTSLYSFHWENPHDYRPVTKSNAPRNCINWEKLDIWSRNRSVGLNPVLDRLGEPPSRIHMM